MSATTMQARPGPRPKTFRFTTALEWMGGRTARMRDEGKPELRVAAPPEFRGEANVWSPEHLLIVALDTCLMITFAGLAAKNGLEPLSYRSDAEGTLEWRDGGYRFTAFVLRPAIVVRSAAQTAQATELIERAHKSCLVAASLTGDVVVEPTITVGDSAEEAS